MLIKFAYHDFIQDKKFNNVTDKTLQNYDLFLGEFIEHCNKHDVLNVNDITANHIKNFLIECQERGNKPLTINTKLQRIKTFFNYLVDEKIVNDSPARKVKRQREDVQIEVFTDEQIQQMLNYYRRIRQRDKSYVAYRNYTLILILLSTGIRRGEVVNLKWTDIDLINRNMRVIGKGRVKETVPITEQLAKELLAFQTFCKQYWGDVSDYVITSNQNKQITINAISQIFKYLQEAMNFPNVRVSAHTFRHTFAHRLAISGMSTFAIQKLLRHRSISQTTRYVAMWGNELKGENDKHNPLNNIEL